MTQPTLEVRSDEGDLEETILGDALHHLPSVDPEFSALREQFRDSLTDKQMEAARFFHQRDQERGAEDRPFAQWFEVSFLDAMIRAVLFDREAEFIEAEGGFFNAGNRRVVRRMSALLKQPRQ